MGVDTRMSEHFNLFFPFLVLVLLKGNTAFVQASCLLSGICLEETREGSREAALRRQSEMLARKEVSEGLILATVMLSDYCG